MDQLFDGLMIDDDIDGGCWRRGHVLLAIMAMFGCLRWLVEGRDLQQSGRVVGKRTRPSSVSVLPGFRGTR